MLYDDPKFQSHRTREYQYDLRQKLKYNKLLSVSRHRVLKLIETIYDLDLELELQIIAGRLAVVLVAVALVCDLRYSIR